MSAFAIPFADVAPSPLMGLVVPARQFALAPLSIYDGAYSIVGTGGGVGYGLLRALEQSPNNGARPQAEKPSRRESSETTGERTSVTAVSKRSSKTGHVGSLAALSAGCGAGTDTGHVAGDSGEPLSPMDQRVLANPFLQRESTAIGALLTKSALRQPSSVELGWKNFAVERRTTTPTEKPERVLDHHFLILWDAHVAEGEIAERGGRFAPYKKFPNTITTCPPGIMPATRGSNEHEVIVGALNASFVEALEAEVDTPPRGSFQTLRATDDSDLRTLLLLLLKESESAGCQGGLYVDSLTTALGMRLLFASRAVKQSVDAKVSPLPLRQLRRVLDRMRAGLSENVDLGILATESGYSRAHFLRMFRAATGQSPHRYLLDLRLAEAQALIANRTMPLIDIALACGFSSHAHLTTAFRSRFGVTPSEYRRDQKLSKSA